ncbi:hypothetical protein ILUMI_20418 [Ignelater luminosus]|uniref:Uncharacterized protein n=1 Tax=Ignelater luminosus TaxID=2038154 RepID=A0A8K0CGE9_IGNLU|nr:hypothetical protein ILUMI_20418 [Ignelater luminosus]
MQYSAEFEEMSGAKSDYGYCSQETEVTSLHHSNFNHEEEVRQPQSHDDVGDNNILLHPHRYTESCINKIPAQLLCSTQYPLYVPRDDDHFLSYHFHSIHIGFDPHSPNFQILLKISCQNKYCAFNEILFPIDYWYELYQIGVEQKFRNFFYDCNRTERGVDRTYDVKLNDNFQLRFIRSVFPREIVNSVTIRVNNAFICLLDFEFERIFYLAALINYHDRCLRTLGFEYHYNIFLDTVAERMILDKNCNKAGVSKETILFTAEMTTTYSIINIAPGGSNSNSLSLLEIIKFFPEKFVNDVEMQIQKLLQARNEEKEVLL